MAHVLVHNWLRGCYRIRRMAHQLVSLSSPSRVLPGIDPPIDRFVNYSSEHRPHYRLPLYYPIKAIFILYLVLPQTQGSSYIYTHQLQPFFQTYEPQIDATLSSFKTRLYAFVQDKLRGLWGNVAISMTQPAAANDLNEGLNDHAMNRGAPPTMQDPVSGPAGLMGSLLSSFGPNLLVQGMALMSSAQNVATTRTNEVRRQNLETPGNSRLNTREGRGSDEPPSNGTGPFEEVDVPSDSEGDYARPTQARSGSWFGRSSTTAGYERVKSD